MTLSRKAHYKSFRFSPSSPGFDSLRCWGQFVKRNEIKGKLSNCYAYYGSYWLFKTKKLTHLFSRGVHLYSKLRTHIISKYNSHSFFLKQVGFNRDFTGETCFEYHFLAFGISQFNEFYATVICLRLVVASPRGPWLSSVAYQGVPCSTI